MDNVRILRYDWYTGRPGYGSTGEYLARQYDHLSDMVVLTHAPKLNNYYLIVTMKETEDGDVKTLEPIQLSGSFWLIPNIYTQLAQEISFQFCCKTESGDFESHSAEIRGRVLPTKDHNGEAIDVDPSIMFDPYKKWVEEIAMAAGAIIIDSALSGTSTNPVQNKVVKAAIDEIAENVNAVSSRLPSYSLAVNVTDGSYVVGSTGGIGANVNLGYSEFSMVPFRGKGIVIQSYLWQGAGYAFLDADGHYITGESANTKGISPAAGELTKVETSVPYNAYSLRVSLHKSYANHSSDYYFRITESKATKYVFVGDSYGTGYNASGSTTGWIDGVASSLGLKAADYDKKAKGGAGFRHPANSAPNETFSELLNLSTLAKNDVGHIVVCGGYNDKIYSESQLLTAFETFAAKAREKFPFAEICIGMIGHTTHETEQATVMSTTRLAYMSMCKKDGVRYLSNVEYALFDSDISSADGVHPDQIGADHLILAIGQALKSGSASIEVEQAANRIYDFLPTDTASGAVASFTDGADNVPLKSLVVNIDLVQDLHGYSSPWPAGGGTNLWDEQWEPGTISGSTGDDLTSTTKIRSVGFIPVSPNTEYRYICEVSSGITFYYSLDKTFLSNYSIPRGGVFTTPENCYFLRFTPTTTYGDTYNHDIAIVLNSTGITTYSPYSNICPISGWTRANITTCGKNVLKNTAMAHTTNNVTYNVNADGSITANNTTIGGNGRCDIFNVSNPSKALLDMFSGKKLAGCPEGGANNTYLVQLIINGTVVCRDYGNGVQIPDLSQYYGASNLYVDASVRTNYTAENLVFKPMISDDAAYGAYEPYNGTEIPISWETEAGTVYGGTLDATNGVLTVDRVKETFVFNNPTEDGTYNLESQRFNLTKRSTGASNSTGKITNVCGAYAYAQANWHDGESHFYVGTTAWTLYLTKDTYRGGNVELCYPLETPITYQLTPRAVNSLLGQNNIYADTGNTTVEYRVDIKTYISRKIAEAVTALS